MSSEAGIPARTVPAVNHARKRGQVKVGSDWLGCGIGIRSEVAPNAAVKRLSRSNFCEAGE